MSYSKEQKEEIFRLFKERLDKALDEEDSLMDGERFSPIWKNLLFILDAFITGTFFGSFLLRFTGSRCWDVKQLERTYKIDTFYTEEEEKITKV